MSRRYPIGAHVPPHYHTPPLDTRPLNEMGYAPPVWRPVRYRRPHAWLFYRLSALRWWLADLWQEARLDLGWVGEAAVLTFCALAVLGLVAALYLIIALGGWLWAWGVG